MSAIRGTRWTPEMVECLGKITDEQLVAKFGLRITASAVAAQRQKRGIPSICTIRNKVVWQPEWLSMLGKSSDEEVASIAGIHKDTVGAKRRAMGLAKYTRGGG